MSRGAARKVLTLNSTCGKNLESYRIKNNRILSACLGFFLSSSDETRKNANGLIKEAISSTITLGDDNLVIELLEFLHHDKKIKTLTDTTELTDYAVFQATVQQKTETLTIILKWIHNTRNKKNLHRNKTYNANQGNSKFNHNAMIYAAKKNDYQRVKILFKYGYRLEQKDNITDPLKKIELFKVHTILLSIILF